MQGFNSRAHLGQRVTEGGAIFLCARRGSKCNSTHKKVRETKVVNPRASHLSRRFTNVIALPVKL
jgi:hypothetical protein